MFLFFLVIPTTAMDKMQIEEMYYFFSHKKCIFKALIGKMSLRTSCGLTVFLERLLPPSPMEVLQMSLQQVMLSFGC